MTDDLSTRLLKAIEKVQRDEVDAQELDIAEWSGDRTTEGDWAHKVRCTECGWSQLGKDPDLEAALRTHLWEHPSFALRLCQAHREIVEDYGRAIESRKAHPDDLAAAGALLALHGVVRVLASAYGIQEET